MYRLLLLHFLAVGALGLETINTRLVNKKVERLIDLSSQLVKITATITLENTGKENAASFLLALEPDTFGNLSYVSAKDSTKNYLQLSKTKVAGREDLFVSVKLNQGLTPGNTAVFNVEYVFTDMLLPFPTSISQKDRQLVRYFGNHYLYTPYPTSEQTTSVVVNSRAIENYSKLKPVSQSDLTVSYGPYKDIAPFTLNQLFIHFESTAPFLTVTRLERLIEVSHWGSIAVKEDIDIFHSGAKLKGSFSRYDYQRDTSSTHHSIRSYKTILPAAAHSIFYRDSNGNISTSSVKTRKDWIELELRPRYPLFGGWRSSYTLGYNVPSYEYLYKNEKGQYVLRMRLLDNVFDDMQVSELETSIVLPVGASNIQLHTPYTVDRLPDDITYKYLDSKGRVIIRLKKTNLVEQHIQDFEIIYNWQPLLLLHEPLLLTGALYVLFLLVIVYVRLDFSIYKSEHQKVQ